jgi:ABC-2 type transport system permease protein
MNRGLVLRALREWWPMTLGLAIALMLVEAILGYVLPTFREQFATQLMQLAFMQKLIGAMLGVDLAGGGGAIGPELFTSIAWVHPVPLALVWAGAIVGCTRVPAGEVDRGTIDVLLGLPVSRRQVFLSESAVACAAGIALMAAAGAGHMLGALGVPPQLRAAPARLIIVLANLLCLYLAVGGIAWLVSSLSDRRGRAITAVFVIVLASFLLNYLAQFWKPAQQLAFLSILHYDRPLTIIRDGTCPTRDMLVLLTVAAAFWLTAGLIFARRDLATT